MKDTVKTKQKLPKWFNGMLYTEGETVSNPFTGEDFELNNVELSMYDFIMGCNMLFESAPNTMTQKRINEFNKALTWFRVNNPRAYMVLLD